jgi:hypothetical protein
MEVDSSNTSQELERLRKEVEYWKNLYNQQLAHNKELERRLKGKEERKTPQAKPKNKPTEAKKSYKRKDEPDREAVLTKLRLACANNDRQLLIQAIADAERLEMPEVEHAKEKLNRLSSSQ